MTERNVRMQALKTEEAVLLPALPRQGLAVGAALKTALRNAEALNERRLSNEVSAAAVKEQAPDPAIEPPAPKPAAAFGALHHVLQRRTRKTR